VTVPTPIYTDLPAIAARILVLASAALSPTPSRQYRSVGPAVWDLDACDQLTVWVSPMQPGQPGQTTTGQYEVSPDRLRVYTLAIEMARCVPSDNPTTADLDTSAAAHLADFQALDGMVKALGFSGKVHDDALKAAGVKAVASGPIQTVPPSGGMAAVRAQILVTV
jgi:hypothetical protein